MKKYLSAALALLCAVLVIVLIVTKSSDNARQESDAGTIADISNRLDTAQSQLTLYEGRLLVFSNRLNDSQSASLTFSNQLIDAQATVAGGKEQIAGLTRRVAEMESESQATGQRYMDLTNQMTSQMADLTKQIALAETSLAQANTNYLLLENRLRRDVAERLVVQRKFYNLTEVQAQMQRLKDDPFTPQVSAQSIYAGLDVEVLSNSLHVISPN